MSRDDEMLTVTYQVSARDAGHISQGSYFECEAAVKAEQAACAAALAARKSLHERWQDSIGKAWCKSGDFLIASESDSSRPCIAKVNEDSEWALENWNETGMLMAAAPELLEALLVEHRECSNQYAGGWKKATIDAIKLALPPDVAAEVLGE